MTAREFFQQFIGRVIMVKDAEVVLPITQEEIDSLSDQELEARRDTYGGKGFMRLMQEAHAGGKEPNPGYWKTWTPGHRQVGEKATGINPFLRKLAIRLLKFPQILAKYEVAVPQRVKGDDEGNAERRNAYYEAIAAVPAFVEKARIEEEKAKAEAAELAQL